MGVARQWEWLIAINDNVTFVSSAAGPDASRGYGLYRRCEEC